MACATELIVVTGASGFIATHIIKQLQEGGYRVRGTVRNLKNEDKVKKLGHLCPDPRFKLELVEADLLDPQSWESAIDGATYVIHVASPVALVGVDNEDDIIKPAVEGTKSVLEACVKAKTVKRVVLTSSVAATTRPVSSVVPVTEEYWTDIQLPGVNAYTKSKVLAEKAAWDFVEKLPAEDKIELAVINPAFTLGPMLNGQTPVMEIPRRLLERKMPALAQINLDIVDVQEVAAAHIKALFTPEAAGHRHIASNENMWFGDIARIYASEFGPQGYKVPTMYAPYFALWLFSFFDKTIKEFLHLVGKECRYDNTRMKEVLGIKPRDVKETLLDTAYSMIEGGFIKKTSKYKGRPSNSE